MCLCWVCVIKTVEPPTFAEYSLHASDRLDLACVLPIQSSSWPSALASVTGPYHLKERDSLTG